MLSCAGFHAAGLRCRQEKIMRHVMRLPGLFALLLLVVGCSQLHTDVRSSYRWAEVSAVGFEAPDRDPWNLAPVVRTELEAMGYAVVAPGGAGQELLVRFSTQDGPDFTSDGVLVTRPKSLHVKLIDPRSQALVGVADYFLRSSEDPVEGMRAALAGLQDALRSAARPSQVRPVAVPSTAPAAAQSAPAAALPVQPQVVAPPSQPAVKPAAQPATTTAAAPTSSAVTPAPLVTSESAASPAQSPGETQAPAETVVEEEAVIRSQEQSPWVPRFKSWGFDEWGKSDDFDQ
jgi:hypothetical protein